MPQLTEIDAEALGLLNLYRAQMNKLRELRLANGMGHESVRRQARMAALTAQELHTEFDLDADELLEQLTFDENVLAISTYAVHHCRVSDFVFALRSVREVTVLCHELGRFNRFADLMPGTRQPQSAMLARQHSLELLLEKGAVEIDHAQEHRVTTITTYHRVVLTPLGEALLARLQD